MLQETLPTLNQYDIDCIFSPANELSGDLYRIIPISEHKIGILLIDLVGKGIQAAKTMDAVLNSVAETLPHVEDLAKALTALNLSLIHNPIVTKFVPLFYGILDTKTHQFDYANCCLEPALFCHNGTITELESTCDFIGVDEDLVVPVETLTFEKNTELLIYTDGLVEARNQNQDTFGIDPCKRMLLEDVIKTSSDFRYHLMKSLEHFSKGQKQHDDITAILIKRTHDTHTPTAHHVQLTLETTQTSPKENRLHLQNALSEFNIHPSVQKFLSFSLLSLFAQLKTQKHPTCTLRFSLEKDLLTLCISGISKTHTSQKIALDTLKKYWDTVTYDTDLTLTKYGVRL